MMFFLPGDAITQGYNLRKLDGENPVSVSQPSHGAVCGGQQASVPEAFRVVAAKPKTIDDYLAVLGEDQRAALEKLRKAIRTAAPKAEECISYRLPAFRLNGKFLVAFGAAKAHCAFYPGALPVAAHKAELKDFSTSKGTIRFPAEKPLPSALVRKLVKTRIAERGG